MVVKFYISMTSGNKEMKKRQMKAQLIMESKGVDFKVIDICDPNCEAERRFMQKNAEPKPGARNAIPPQFFNDEEYCGDYDGFDEANETDCLEEFLKLPRGSLPQVPIIHHNLSNFSSREVSLEKEVMSTQMNGTSSNRQTPEQTQKAVKSHNDDEEEEEEEEDEYEEEEEEEAAVEGDKSTFQGEPSGSLVVEETSVKEDAVQEQHQSNVESQKQHTETEGSEEEEDEEEEDEDVEHPKVEPTVSVQEQQTPSENLNDFQQPTETSMADAARAEDQNATLPSDTQPSLKASSASEGIVSTEDATEAGIVHDEREQAPVEEHERIESERKEASFESEKHVVSKDLNKHDAEHDKLEQERKNEHDLGCGNESEALGSSDVSRNEQLASAVPIQKHAIQDDAQGRQSSVDQQLQQSAAKCDTERAKSSENDPALSGERVEASNEKAVKEEQEEEEESEEESEEEEDEEDQKIISALPDEDDLMEMSTTVATAERFTEFSYKQLPGEA